MKFQQFLSYVLFALVASCAQGDESIDSGPSQGVPGGGPDHPQVVTSFFPTTWLVRRLSGGEVDVSLPLPPGADPIFWQPSREELLAIQGADLIVLNGAELEKWVAGASLPLSRVVETAGGFRESWREYSGVTHVHGGGGEHNHIGVDGHTWMSPELFELQAQALGDELRARGLVSEEVLAAGLREVRRELQALARRMREEVLPRTAEVRFLTNHPAFDYLLADHVDLVNLDLDPDSEDISSVVSAVREGRGDAVHSVLLWEAEPRPQLREALEKELGVLSVLFTPAENPAERASNYSAIQANNIDRLIEALGRL
ncbi:MAG: zinc transport system substrate-binding protein [Planctomycetota bacterium]|jgi:zinc transport system substrate-binding protein